MAQNALARGERKEAAKAFVRAIASAQERGALPRVAAKSIGWLRETPSDELLDALPIDVLDEAQRARLDGLLGERALSAGARQTAKARLALAEGQKDAAGPLFEEAAQAAPDSLATQLHAGRYFLHTRPNLDKSLRYLQAAFRLAPNNDLVLFSLLNAYLAGELFDKAQALLEPLKMLWPDSPFIELVRAQIAQGAKNPALARETLSALLKTNEDYIPAIKLDAQFAKAGGDAAREKAALDLLARLEPPAEKPANAPAKADPKAAAKAKPKAENAPPLVRPNLQNMAFSVNAELLSALPKEIKSVALINLLDTPGWPAQPSLGDYLTTPFLPKAEPLGADLAQALSQSGLTVHNDPELARALKLQNGAFSAEALNAVLAQSGTEAVLLFDLSKSTNIGYVAHSFGYKRGDKDVAQATGEIALGREKVSCFNVFVLILPLLLLLAIVAAVVTHKRRGQGGLLVQLLYDESFEDGYFALRLSRHPLKQAFNVEPLMKKRYTDSRADTDRKIRALLPLLLALQKNGRAQPGLLCKDPARPLLRLRHRDHGQPEHARPQSGITSCGARWTSCATP